MLMSALCPTNAALCQSHSFTELLTSLYSLHLAVQCPGLHQKGVRVGLSNLSDAVMVMCLSAVMTLPKHRKSATAKRNTLILHTHTPHHPSSHFTVFHNTLRKTKKNCLNISSSSDTRHTLYCSTIGVVFIKEWKSSVVSCLLLSW